MYAIDNVNLFISETFFISLSIYFASQILSEYIYLLQKDSITSVMASLLWGKGWGSSLPKWMSKKIN